jgi:hypothetical protein
MFEWLAIFARLVFFCASCHVVKSRAKPGFFAVLVSVVTSLSVAQVSFPLGTPPASVGPPKHVRQVLR